MTISTLRAGSALPPVLRFGGSHRCDRGRHDRGPWTGDLGPPARLLAALVLAFAPALAAPAEPGRFMIPAVSGRPGLRPFSGHPGWVDVYRAGYNEGQSARINADGSFDLPPPDKPVCLIALFDKIETPPVIVPRWPVKPGDFDVPIPVEYACVPEGYPETWDREYALQALDFCQTFVARGTALYGMTLFDGPKPTKWMNKMHIVLLQDGPTSEPRPLRNQISPDPGYSGNIDRMTSGYSDHDLLRAGWRHGNMETVPGKTYTIRAETIYPHHGNRYPLAAYARPDKGDGYPHGQAFADAKPLESDLCCLIFGNSHGQLVENQLRWDDWEVFLPGHRPAVDWGQSFISHGVSLAGVSFWAGTGDETPVTCEVRIHEDGPWGRLLKPTKVARGHESPLRPTIIYPDTPRPKAEDERYYHLPCRLFQVGFLPDEVKLTPDKTYYIQLIPSKPLLVYADGDYYQEGYAYYEGLKVDQQVVGRSTKHSRRWTLLMNIVTYARPGGEPLTPE